MICISKICNIILGKNDISVNGTCAGNESCVLGGGEEAMEEDGVPGEEQSEEIKKKKRVGTLREGRKWMISHVLYNNFMFMGGMGRVTSLFL